MGRSTTHREHGHDHVPADVVNGPCPDELPSELEFYHDGTKTLLEDGLASELSRKYQEVTGQNPGSLPPAEILARIDAALPPDEPLDFQQAA